MGGKLASGADNRSARSAPRQVDLAAEHLDRGAGLEHRRALALPLDREVPPARPGAQPPAPRAPLPPLPRSHVRWTASVREITLTAGPVLNTDEPSPSH